MEITFGSLFAGIGGLDLGFERLGMECKWQVEIDDYSNKVLEKHWPNVHREGDINDCSKENLERVDIIAGGFPCQDISYAGRGAGLDGERSGLFFEAIRLVRELQPRAVVLENVAGLLTRGLDRVLGTLAEIGYDAEWHCIPAAAVGAPHIRDRIFILSYANSHSQSTKSINDEAPRLSQFVTDTESIRRGEGLKDTRRSNAGTEERQAGGPGCRGGSAREVSYPNSERGRSRNTQRQDAENARQSSRRAEHWGWHSEPAVGRVANGIPKRVDRLRGLGNAIVPQVAEVVGRIVMERLGEAK